MCELEVSKPMLPDCGFVSWLIKPSYTRDIRLWVLSG